MSGKARGSPDVPGDHALLGGQDSWRLPALSSDSNTRNAERYWVWETEAELYGRKFRLVVVRSTAQHRQKAQALQRKVREEAQQLQRAVRGRGLSSLTCTRGTTPTGPNGH